MSISPDDLFLAPCSRTNKENTYRHFQDTILNGINPGAYEEVPDFDRDQVPVWGVVSGNQSHWQEMKPGDVVLFYTKTRVYTHIGEVTETIESAPLGDDIWSTYDEGRRVSDLDEPWPYIFFLKDIERVDIPSQPFHSDIGWSTYYPQSFTRVINRRRSRLIEQHGSLAAALRHHQQHNAVSDPEQVAEETEQLLVRTEEDPPLTEETEYSEQERVVRSRAFREAVREAYDDQCAICGSERQTVSGTPEVEAAHIYPRSEGGATHIGNGIALCKLHHWAFDSGWLSVDTDYTILLRDLPERDTYAAFETLEGETLNLPENEELYPQQKFLEAHWELNGFDT